ncbi:uncharacterized protein K452DRAFT_280780 [Aplosporella prunicola CBS 121167]|uniref:Uncharacterized protein n=1 Tax=Aplosporella prunicola CBS 121167 TaxID=1176127 RepID=A0A6A6AY64_9PEZI|nr:uncharacterized protein K452DRAFT_280780 [Aplosporella prunicola CBS 121167]KAF2135904.1 hypothetical protein K452DRAFT_280780 [Aplosporella prunicola CBS 121167]
MSKVPPPNEPSWPPKSPHQALLSSPSGRKKWQQRRDNASPSASPAKRLFGTPKAASRAPISLSDDVDDNAEDEDEETLQLKLQAIEARLRLKKLQAAKAKQSTESPPDKSKTGGPLSPRARNPSHQAPSRQAESASAVQVPLSPSADRRAPQKPASPARVLLGIDKGLRAQDVSLKRPSSSRATFRSGPETRHGRSNSYAGASGAQGRNSSLDKPKSFSERLAESRVKENEKEAKDERIQKARSRGFGIGAKDMNTPSQPSSESEPHSFHRATKSSQDIRQTKHSLTSPTQSFDSNTSRPSFRRANPSFDSTTSSAAKHGRKPSAAEKFKKPAASAEPSRSSPDDTSLFDPYSGIHLSKRSLSHNVLSRAFSGKEIYHLPRLLQTVKGPNYEPPDVEADYVVMGVIAQKSQPRNTKNQRKIVSSTEDDDEEHGNRSKFMVLRLIDFKWEIDLFLFDTAFQAFWKLTPGTLVAVLNPSIMPPRDRNTGQFSLKLGSSEDTILEIGNSRDLGFCKSIKKDGEKCGTWIDKRKTEFCEFHVYLQVEKHKRGRMEVNTMTGFGSGPKGQKGSYSKGNGGGSGGGGGGGGYDRYALPSEGRYHDAFLHETAYILPAGMTGRSAAERLDADDGALDRGMSREELHRKRLAERERERELAEKLGRMGGKAGGEYMRAKASGASGASGGHDAGLDAHAPPDAAALGLLGKRAADVTLSPVKRKRAATTASGSTGGTTASARAFTAKPMGWGGAGRREWLGEGTKVGGSAEKSEREASPAKKRARLVIEGKGIREPGRESLGGLGVDRNGGVLDDEDDDDDDLEIV